MTHLYYTTAVSSFHLFLYLELSERNGYKYVESAGFFEKAFSLMEDVEAEHLYFCSCSFALAKNPIKTVEYLKKAIQNGFDDFDRIKNEEAFKIIGNSLDLDNILRI